MRRTPLVVVFLTVFIDLLGFGIVVPLLPRYAETHGANEFQAGLLVAAYSVAQFLFAPLWGHLSDLKGRKPILVLTLGGNVIAYSLFAAAPGLTMLFVSRSLSGFFGANISTAQAYVADVTTKADRARGMGIIGMAFGLGFVLGPATGGILAEHVGIWAPGAAAATLSLVAFSLAATRLAESLPAELRSAARRRSAHPILEIGVALRHERLSGLLILFFLMMFGFANLEAMMPLFLRDRFGFDAAHTGYVFAFIGVCIAFTQGYLLTRVTRKFGEPKVLRYTPWLIAIGMQLYWLAPTVGIYLLVVPVVATGMGLSNPSVVTLISKRTPPEIQGRTLGLSQSVGSLARALSPGLAGWLYHQFPRAGGSIAPFIWGGAVVAAGAILGRPALRDEPPSADDDSARV